MMQCIMHFFFFSCKDKHFNPEGVSNHGGHLYLQTEMWAEQKYWNKLIESAKLAITHSEPLSKIHNWTHTNSTKTGFDVAKTSFLWFLVEKGEPLLLILFPEIFGIGKWELNFRVFFQKKSVRLKQDFTHEKHWNKAAGCFINMQKKQNKVVLCMIVVRSSVNVVCPFMDCHLHSSPMRCVIFM